MADLSGTITSGGTAQTIAAFNPARRSLFIQNPSDTAFWIRFGGAAAAATPSIQVLDGDSIVLGEEFRELICRSISIFGATTGKAFTIFDSTV